MLTVYLLELSHPSWAAPLRYAEDTRDWTVTLEDGATVATFTATGFDAEAAAADDSGIDTRQLSVPDPTRVLWRAIEALRGSDLAGPAPGITATMRVYDSADLSAPLTVSALTLQDPVRDDIAVSFTATTADTINRDAPTRKFTWENSPGLRGR